MNKWFGAALLALTMTTAAFADNSQKIVPINTPVIVIHADRHGSGHAAKFQTVLNKSGFWRNETQTKGYDVAFTEWMRADHPWEFAAVCMKAAENVKKNEEHTSHMGEFNSAQGKDAGLRANVQKVGTDAAFMDWLRTHHPDSYKAELAKVGVSDATSKWSHKQDR